MSGRGGREKEGEIVVCFGSSSFYLRLTKKEEMLYLLLTWTRKGKEREDNELFFCLAVSKKNKQVFPL